MFQRRRRGLSPLLAIIIGLIIVIVAGILLSQLYFSYTATISHRPACNIEHVDLVYVGGDDGQLVINVKNVGNVRIIELWLETSVRVRCWRHPYTPDHGRNTNIPPGSTGAIVCRIYEGISPGRTFTATLRVTFEDDSIQKYPIAVRAR